MLKVAIYMQVPIIALPWTSSSPCMSQGLTYIWPSINCVSHQPCLTLKEFATSALKNASTKWSTNWLSPSTHKYKSDSYLLYCILMEHHEC